MKGITPVISLIMLMLVTVGIVGVSYTWFSGLMASNTEKIITIPPGGAQCYNNKINVIVRNSGTTTNITDDDIVVADINGVSVRNTLFFGGFNQNGLVGYWRFEQSNGSAATNDSSGYGNMGTLTNMNLTGNSTSGLTTNGRFGNALVFDGVNDYVDAGSAVSLYTPTLTVSAWIYENTLPKVGDQLGIVEQSITPGYSGWSMLTCCGGGSSVYVFNAANTGGSLISASAGTVTTGRWIHLVGTVDNSFIKIYRNGVLSDSQPFTTAVRTNTQTIKIGKYAYFGETNSYFNGAIDEVQIWNRVLSFEEISQLNKTNSGNFTLGPNQGTQLIRNYPIFASGKYTVRIGTRSNVAEMTVDCL
ncbi:MAG: LamG domain-containing protein [Candidatus Aenigmatarchaeota archaeon]